MAVTSPEAQTDIEHSLVPKEAYEYLFSDKERKPRHSVSTAPEVSEPTFTDGSLPAELETFMAERKLAITLRKAAAEVGQVVQLDDMPREHVITTERALARYGQEIAAEQGVSPTLVGVAEIQVNELLAKDTTEIIDAPSLVLSALALARMETSDRDMIERKAATQALGALPHEPEQIELVKRQTLGHDTGELAVRAILEHQPQLLAV